MFTFLIGDGNTNDSELNCIKHSTNLICPYFVSECSSDLSVFSQTFKLMPYFKTKLLAVFMLLFCPVCLWQHTNRDFVFSAFSWISTTLPATSKSLCFYLLVFRILTNQLTSVAKTICWWVPSTFNPFGLSQDFPNGIFYSENAKKCSHLTVSDHSEQEIHAFYKSNCTYDCYHFKAARIFISNMSLVLITIKLMFTTLKHNALNLLTFTFSIRERWELEYW